MLGRTRMAHQSINRTKVDAFMSVAASPKTTIIEPFCPSTRAKQTLEMNNGQRVPNNAALPLSYFCLPLLHRTE
jgi:hypothetical protein